MSAEEVKLTPQQLIAQSAKATAEALTDALTSRSALIALPTYDWESQDAYHTFTVSKDTRQLAFPLSSQDRQRRSPPLRLCSTWNESTGAPRTMDAPRNRRQMEGNQGKSHRIPEEDT